MKSKRKPLHPFPARMAPELVLNRLKGREPGARVLDPMMGSGTTIAAGRSRGYETFGIDRDPLAILIATASSTDLDADRLARDAAAVLRKATNIERRLDARCDFPGHCDKDTRAFLRYWFDAQSRRELLALLRALDAIKPPTETFIKCAISRMIITKQGGVSLAEDVSHSRPHRTRDTSPVHPFDLFPRSIRHLSDNAEFRSRSGLPRPIIRAGDCRNLSRFEDDFFDYVITSPPYLTAIDYLRGHKLSLIWFGKNVDQIRELRSTNVGTECGTEDQRWDSVVDVMVARPERMSSRFRNVTRRYAKDLTATLAEIARVTKPGGRVVFVVGDCTLRGVDVLNSEACGRLSKSIATYRRHRSALRTTRSHNGCGTR